MWTGNERYSISRETGFSHNGTIKRGRELQQVERGLACGQAGRERDHHPRLQIIRVP